MLLSENKLIMTFEREIWLFVDKSLPKDRMNYWEEKLSESEELKEYFDETIYSLKYYSNSSEFDIDNVKFAKMIDVATNKKSFWQSANKFIKSITDRKRLQPYYGRLVLAFTILVTVITTLLLTQNSFRKLNQNNSILDWNAKTITAQIEEVETLLTNLERKDSRKSIINNYLNNEWTYNYFQIQTALEKWKLILLINNKEN